VKILECFRGFVLVRSEGLVLIGTDRNEGVDDATALSLYGNLEVGKFWEENFGEQWFDIKINHMVRMRIWLSCDSEALRL
jgi:hypothetical protein